MSPAPDRRPEPTDDWQATPPGELVRFASRLRSRRSRRRFLRAVGGTVAALAAGGGGFWIWRATAPLREYHYAGISCSEVAELVEPLEAGTLPEAKARQVREHIRLCPHCRPRFGALVSS